jgi:hypothetical protein
MLVFFSPPPASMPMWCFLVCCISSVRGNRLETNRHNPHPYFSHLFQGSQRPNRHISPSPYALAPPPCFCKIFGQWRWPLLLPSGHHPPCSSSLICWLAANSAVPPWRTDGSASWVPPRAAGGWPAAGRLLPDLQLSASIQTQSHTVQRYSLLCPLFFSSSIFSFGNYYGHVQRRCQWFDRWIRFIFEKVCE